MTIPIILAVITACCTVVTTACIVVQTFLAAHIRRSANLMASFVRPPREKPRA